MVDIPVAADGTAGAFHGQLTSGTDFVIGTGVQTANTTTFIAHIRGIYGSSSADNTLGLKFRSEINGSAARVMPGTMAYFYNL